MTSSWRFVWMAFMAPFLVSPVSYGWGHRGWGPPYPRHIQRGRRLWASTTAQTTDLRRQAWGRAGHFVWVALLLAMGCFFAGLVLR